MDSGSRARALLGVVLACGLFCSCGDDASPPYLGSTGTPVEMALVDGVPAVEVTITEARGGPLVVDSGAPLTLFSDQAVALPPGELVRGQLEGLGPVFPRFEAPVLSLFDEADWPCVGAVPIGLLGADLLGLFRVRLDYQSGRMALEAASEPPANRSEDEVDVTFELLGGGRIRIGELERRVGATRIVSPISIDGADALGLLDTGASMTLIEPALFDRLPDNATRPVGCCVTLGGPSVASSSARLVRLREVRLGPLALENVAVLVVGGGTLLDDVSREVGRRVSVILGTNILRRFRHEIDYKRRTWRLEQVRPAEASLDRFVGPGFSYCRARDDSGALIVRDVYRESDAERHGVRSGDRVFEIDGRSVALLDDEALHRLVATPRAEPVALRARRAGGELRWEIRVEDALPLFP